MFLTELSFQTDMAIKIEAAKQTDLNTINHVIEAAIMKWNLPERVKRLSLASYFYTELDLKHFEIVVAKQDKKIVAVASWEAADTKDTPQHKSGLLLHGLYVNPDIQRQGVGKKLLQAAENAAQAKGVSGLLVKAQPDAIDFFLHHKMHEVKIQDSSRDYAHRLWKPVSE